MYVNICTHIIHKYFFGNPEELGPMISNLGHYFLMITDRFNKNSGKILLCSKKNLGILVHLEEPTAKSIKTQNGLVSFIEKLHFWWDMDTCSCRLSAS